MGRLKKVVPSGNPMVIQTVVATHCSTSQATMPLVTEANLTTFVDTINDPFISQRSAMEDNPSTEL